MPRILVINPHDATSSPPRVQLDPDTTLEFRAVGAATESIGSHQDRMLADLAVLQAGLDAQRDGFDAVCVETMSDAGLSALRSVLDIPVVASGKASMLYALTLGGCFSVLAPSDAEAQRFHKATVEYGLRHQCASVRAFDATGGDAYSAMVEVGRRAIHQDRAEVLCLGSTALHGFAVRLGDALSVPVVDPVPLMLKLTETFLALRLTHSRRSYAEPVKRKEALIHALMRGAAQREQGPNHELS
jgi:allantoin racemase